MATVLGANSVTGGYDVENSLRFNFGSSDYLNLTAAGNSTLSTKGTWSTWVKKSNPGSSKGPLFSGYADASNRVYMVINADALTVFGKVGGTVRYTAQVDQNFRDPSAWMNIVVAIDTTQGTAANRIKIYINGTAATIGDTNTPVYPVQDTAIPYAATSSYTNLVGALYSTSLSQYLDGYLAETVFVDGLALNQNSFGEFDSSSGIWKPIDVSGLTFGDNGFYLEYKGSGTSANASGLGADTSGNTSHFTVNNLTAVDQSTDTCTNNFATMNSLDNFFSGSAFTEGNCKIVTTNGNITYNTSTIGFSSGKWYMETKLAGSAGFTVGVVRGVATANDNDNKLGNRADGFSYDDGGAVEGNGGDLGGSFATYEADDIIGVYADLDNNELYFSKNGALQNSGTGLALTAGTYFFAVGDNNSSNSSTYEVNFGNPVSALSSAVSDGDYGAFEYSTTITGDSVSKTFKALNTKNLAEFG